MKNLARFTLFLLTLAIVLAAGLATAEAKAKGKKKDRGSDPSARLQKKLSAADLSTEGKAKAEKVLQENAGKLKEAQAKVDAVLTAEQKQAQRQAQKDARSSGKKGKDAQASVAAALKLTDEQKSKLASAESDLKSAQAALAKDLRNSLSSEDFAKLGLKAKNKKKKA
jgi:hypothetical protein